MFPVKSLDGAGVEAAELTARGGFRNDRRFALIDARGKVVNGKRDARVHALRVAYDAALDTATFTGGSPSAFYSAAGEGVAFRIGAVDFVGTNPCQRCIVPSRDPETGKPLAAFAKRVAEMRAATLPQWADRTRFDHFYRLAVNTRALPFQTGRTISVGDAVAIASTGTCDQTTRKRTGGTISVTGAAAASTVSARWSTRVRPVSSSMR